MRLDSILNSVHVLSSLWGALTGSAVCAPSPSLPTVVSNAASTPLRRAAFVDVNVVPMDTERVLAHQTVLIEDGKITALGPVNQVKVPEETVRIDGRGKYLIPGLSNMHWHGRFSPGESADRMDPTFASPEGIRAFADRYLANGVTTIRTLEGPHIDRMQQLRRSLKTGEFPNPRMYLARDIPPSLLAAPNKMAAYVAESKAMGYDHIGTAYDLEGRTPIQREVLDSLLAAARRARLPVSAHSHGLPFDAALAIGAAGGSVDHLYMFWDSLLGISGPLSTGMANRSEAVQLSMSKVPALVTTLKRAGVWITPTLACMQRIYAPIKGLPQLVRALQDAGVGLLLGQDGSDLYGELVALVQAGFTPYQSLLTGTRNVAQYFGKLDSSGTVTVGKWADLVLLHGNPLTSIRHIQEPAGVMIAGQWIDRSTLDQRLLISPRLWLQELMSPHIPDLPPGFSTSKQFMRERLSQFLSTPRSMAQWDELEERGTRIYALADSLDQTDRQVYGSMVASITTELGLIRDILAPEQREAFDNNLRVWLREQTRRGYAVVIPGVTMTH